VFSDVDPAVLVEVEEREEVEEELRETEDRTFSSTKESKREAMAYESKTQTATTATPASTPTTSHDRGGGEACPGEHHHQAWMYLKRHSADWYEETKSTTSYQEVAACVIDLDGDDLFPRTGAGGGTTILSLGLAEETGEDIPEGFFANHDMVGKAPWDALLESAEARAEEREHFQKIQYLQQQQGGHQDEGQQKWNDAATSPPLLQKAFEAGDTVYVKLWAGRWQKTGKTLEYQHKQTQREEGRVKNSPLRHSGLAQGAYYGQGREIPPSRRGSGSGSGSGAAGQVGDSAGQKPYSRSVEGDGGAASHKRFELVNHEALCLTWPVAAIERVGEEHGGMAPIAELLQPTECMRLAHELMRICNENEEEKEEDEDKDEEGPGGAIGYSGRGRSHGNRAVGVHIWQQKGPPGYAEAVGRSFAQLGRSVRHYRSRGIASSKTSDDAHQSGSRPRSRASKEEDEFDGERALPLSDATKRNNHSPLQPTSQRSLKVPSLVAQSSMYGAIDQTPRRGSVAATMARRLGTSTASRDFNALLKYFIERASDGSRRLAQCYTQKNVQSFSCASTGIHHMESRDRVLLDVLVTFDLTTPLLQTRRSRTTTLSNRPSHVRVVLFAKPTTAATTGARLKTGRSTTTTTSAGHTLHLRVELWRARDWHHMPGIPTVGEAAQAAMARHVCWTAWKCRFWMNPGAFVLARKNGVPVGDYFDEHHLCARWQHMFPNTTTKTKTKTKTHTNDQNTPGATAPRIEAAPYSRAFYGKIIAPSKKNFRLAGATESYFDVQFSDGVLSRHVVTVHCSALTHAERHYCQYRRIQNNYFWERRDDSGFENGRHFCFGAPPPENLGGPVISRINRRLERMRSKYRRGDGGSAGTGGTSWLQRRRLGSQINFLKAKRASMYGKSVMRKCPTCQEWFCAAHLTGHQLCSDKGCNTPESMTGGA
jgi:hypothetical protein